MAIALHVGVRARPDEGSANRFGSTWDEVLAGVYAAHYDRLMGFFVRRTRDRALAEDLAHDTFVRFVRARESFDVSRPAWPYLKATANNVLIDYLRRSSRQVDIDVERQLDDDGASEPRVDDLVALRELLDAAMDLLPERQRMAVDLRLERGWSLPDAAEFLGVSPGTLSQLLFRARQTMRGYLEDVSAGVQGVALPVLLAFRWRWREWTARSRTIAQTPAPAMTMEAVASVMVAATLGMAALTAAGQGTSHSPMASPMTAVPVAPSSVAMADARLAETPGVTASARDVSTLEVTESVARESPARTTTLHTPTVPSDAAVGVVSVEEDPARFVVSHELEARTGTDILSAEGDAIYVGCESLIGDVVCQPPSR